MDYVIYNGELYHHGIKGQKWGIRRYQNEDGSLTKEGRARLRGYDGSDDPYATDMSGADSYATSWMRNYGYTPMNRLRFEYNDDRYSSGERYVSDYDWNRTSLEDIYDSYREYRDSEDWD